MIEPLQVVCFIGAALVLAGYAGLQLHLLTRDDAIFHLLNGVGSALLGWIAIVDQRVGFILLEAAWTLLSVMGLVRVLRRKS